MENLNVLKSFSVAIFIGSWLIAGFPTQPVLAAGPLEQKKTIAVVEFAVRGSDIDPQAGAIIADSMTSAIASPYQAGIRLPAGAYEIEVSHPGHVTQKASARIAENDVTMLINLAFW